ncbi:hypothetical protein GCM10020331_092290 [Ectobacillus funiculus]
MTAQRGAYFHKSSHGFRPDRGTHTALKEYRQKWQATNWIIEGDIKGYFDNIDHHTLINILKKKIQDEKFIRLIWKLLRAGYMEFSTFANSLIGAPQGGIVSPILANVYLNELDNKAEELKKVTLTKVSPSGGILNMEESLQKKRLLLKEKVVEKNYTRNQGTNREKCAACLGVFQMIQNLLDSGISVMQMIGS